MALRVAIQMDRVDLINPHSDSTLVLMREAQKRGHELFYYTPDKLTYREGRITASGHRLTLDPVHYHELGEKLAIDLRAMDVVLLRQDPPFNMTYLSTTYILEQLQPDVLVVNDPASVRNNPEKLFPTLFRQFMPPTLVSADTDAIAAFRDEHKDIIIKPLYGHGGHAVLRLKPDDDNFAALMEMLFATSKEPWMVQPFLPEVATGDRRIILIEGSVGGVMGRIPAEHEIRANFRVGGTAAAVELSPRQQEICDALAPALRQYGLIFVGLDVIGDYLTEINVTSPTGLVAMNKLYDTTLQADIWDAIEARL
jgi:glutathione synthase